MKKLALIAFILISSVSVFAGRQFNSPEAALMNNSRVSSYISNGFDVVSVLPNAHRYIVAPTGNFEWGFCVAELRGSTGGYMSLETTYVTADSRINGHEKNGNVKYSVANLEITESVVY